MYAINESYVNNNTNNFTTANRGVNDIHWIVIHYTANPGSTAANNCQYYDSGNTGGVSAHFFVDPTGIYRCVREKDIAGHCGKWTSSRYLTDCRNGNSIGIEMCCQSKSGMKASQLTGTEADLYIENKTIVYTTELVRDLMRKYNIPINRVIRHYDVHSGYKLCPSPFVGSGKKVMYGNKTGDTLWQEFLKMVSTNVPMTAPSSDKYTPCNGTLTVTYTGTDGVNLHSTPDVNSSSVIGAIYHNNKYRVVGKVTGSVSMYRFEDGHYITASNKYVSYTDNTTFKKWVGKVVCDANDVLNVRDFPNVSGNKISELANGNLIDIIEEAYNSGAKWYYIHIKNSVVDCYGYIHGNYVKRV